MGWGGEKKWAWVRSDVRGAGAGKKSEFWAGVPEKKIRKKRGRGLGGKNWAGAGV